MLERQSIVHSLMKSCGIPILLQSQSRQILYFLDIKLGCCCVFLSYLSSLLKCNDSDTNCTKYQKLLRESKENYTGTVYTADSVLSLVRYLSYFFEDVEFVHLGGSKSSMVGKNTSQ